MLQSQYLLRPAHSGTASGFGSLPVSAGGVPAARQCILLTTSGVPIGSVVSNSDGTIPTVYCAAGVRVIALAVPNVGEPATGGGFASAVCASYVTV